MNIERLAGGLGAAEGPAFLPDGRCIFVEIWRSRVSVWTAQAEVEMRVDARRLHFFDLDSELGIGIDASRSVPGSLPAARLEA